MTKLYFIKDGRYSPEQYRGKKQRETHTHTDTDRHTKIETDIKYNDSRNKKLEIFNTISHDLYNVTRIFQNADTTNSYCSLKVCVQHHFHSVQLDVYL